MSILSEVLEGIGAQVIAGAVTGAQQGAAEALGVVVGKLPTADNLAARVLGNPKTKAWLRKQTAEDQEAVRRAVPVLVAAVIESVRKDLSR